MRSVLPFSPPASAPISASANNQTSGLKSNLLAVVAALVVLVLVTAGSAHADIIDYTDFSDVSDLTFNGNASQTGTTLQLTPNSNLQRGSVFFNNQVEVGSGFTSTFNIDMTNASANGGADGILFVLQNDPRGVTALGAVGGRRGYDGSGAIVDSVALGFQTWTSDNTQILQYGGPTIGTGSGFTGEITNLEVTVAWDALTQVLSIDHANLASPLTQTVDLTAVLGSSSAYVGFTAATGGGNATQRVNSWTFTSVNSVPEPTTAISLVLMFGGLAISRRRRRVLRLGTGY